MIGKILSCSWIVLMFIAVVITGIFLWILKWSIVVIGVLLLLKVISMIFGFDSIGNFFDSIIQAFKQ